MKIPASSLRMFLASSALSSLTVLLVLALTGMQTGADSSGTVRAREYLLVDGTGKAAARLGTNSVGEPSLELFAPNSQRPGLRFSLDSGTPSIEVLDPDSRREGYGARLVISSEGEPGDLSLRLIGPRTDDDKAGQVLMQVARDGTPSIALRDLKGAVIWSAPTGK